VVLGPFLVIQREVLAYDLPRFLRDDQQPDTEARHDRHRLRRHRRGIGAAAERAQRKRADVAPGLGRDRAAFEPAAFQPFGQEFRIFDKSCTAFALIDAKAAELDITETTAEAEDHAAAGQMVEQRDLLGDAHRIVPRQHDDARPEFDAGRASRHVGQELQYIGAHRVVGEVMLDAPDGIEAERLGEFGQANFLAIDFRVRQGIVWILEQGGISDVHGCSPRGASPPVTDKIELTRSRRALCRLYGPTKLPRRTGQRKRRRSASADRSDFDPMLDSDATATASPAAVRRPCPTRQREQ